MGRFAQILLHFHLQLRGAAANRKLRNCKSETLSLKIR